MSLQLVVDNWTCQSVPRTEEKCLCTKINQDLRRHMSIGELAEGRVGGMGGGGAIFSSPTTVCRPFRERPRRHIPPVDHGQRQCDW